LYIALFSFVCPGPVLRSSQIISGMFAAHLHPFKELSLLRRGSAPPFRDCKSTTFSNTEHTLRKKKLYPAQMAAAQRGRGRTRAKKRPHRGTRKAGTWKSDATFGSFFRKMRGFRIYNFTYFNPHRYPNLYRLKMAILGCPLFRFHKINFFNRKKKP